MSAFACPHCGALKDRLRRVAELDSGDDDGDDLAFVFCNACLGLIVWAPHAPCVTRAPTVEESQAIRATAGGAIAFRHALLCLLERMGAQ